jgi:hypothetical protein
MKYKDKTKEQLINELAELHQPIKELRARETGRRQADEALKRSETRYRRLFETAQGGILLLDADTGQILDFFLLITCSGCFWGWEHDRRGYDDGDHDGYRHDDRRDLDDHR